MTTTNRRKFLKSMGVGAGGSVALAGCVDSFGSGGTPTLSILGWTAYDKDKEDIEENVGVKLESTRSSDSAKMFSAWNGGQYEDYDIAVPNNNYIPKFIQADLVAPVNKDAVTNYDDLYDKFKEFAQAQATDSDGNLYAVPIRYGWYGYAYDSDLLPEDHEHSYEVLFSEEHSGVNLAESLVMDDAYNKPITMTALYLGYEDAFKETTIELSDDQLQTIKEELINQKELLFGYISAQAPYRKAFKQGNVIAGQAGRYLAARLQDDGLDSVKMANPKEGEITWYEGGLVSKASDNKELAWEVVNEYISPEYGAKFAEANSIPSCSAEATANLSSEAKKEIGFEPSRLDGMYSFKTIPNEDQWVKVWEEVKSA